MAGAQPPTDMAANQPPPADPMQVPPPADPMAGAPPPAPDMAATDPMAGSTPEMAPPPVAGTTGDVPPPPPAEPVMKKTPATAEVAEDDMTTTMGIAGLGLVGLAVLFIMMKKNRARRIDLSQTQV